VHLRCARQAAALLPVASQSAEELAAERAVTAAALESAAAAEAARRQAAQAAAQAAAVEMAAAEAAAEALPCELHEAAAAGDAAEVTKLNGRPMHACAHHGALSPQVSNTIPTSSSTRKQIQVAMDAAGGKPAGAGGIDIDRVLALLENTEAGAAAAPPPALTTALARRSLPEGAEMGADGSQAVAAFGQEQEQQQEQEEEQEKEQQQQQQKEQEQEVRPSL